MAVLAYVANYSSGTVSVIDTATNAVTATVTVGTDPTGVAVTPDGSYAYVANAGSTSVSVIDTATNAVVATITVGAGPYAVAITPNGDYAYVANYSRGTVSVIDTATNAVTATVTVGTDPPGVAVTPDGSYAYVANEGSGTVSVIDTATNAVTETFTVGTDPTGVAVTPDGSYAYVANEGSGTVSVIDTATNAVTATVTVGTQPLAVAVTPDGSYAYVTDNGSGTVSVIDTATNAVTATVTVGTQPYGVAVTPDGSYAYVANYSSGTVSVIDTATNAVTATVTVGTDPIGVAIASAYGDPQAPTLLTPPNAAYTDLSGTPAFTWQYNNTDGTTQADWAFREKVSGASAYNYWNVSTAAWQTTIVWNAGSSGSYTFPSGAWANGSTYNWSVNTESSAGLTGVFASDFTVTGQLPPTVSVTAPTGTVADSHPPVTWSATFPSGAVQTAYQVRTFSAAQYGASGFNPAVSAATDDSGVVAGTATSYQVATGLTSASYRSYVQVTETGGEVSGWTAYTPYTVVVDEPPAPVLTAETATLSSGYPVIELQAQCDLNYLSAVDGSFESGIGTFVGTNCALTQSSAEALDGSYSLALTASAAGNMSALSGYYTISPSLEYTMVASFYAGATARSVQAQINWYTSAEVLISSSTGTAVTDSTTAWTKATVTGTAPSTAAYATVELIVQAAASAEVHYADEVGLFPRAGTTWSGGGFLASAGVIITRSDGLYVRNASPANPAPVPPDGQLVVVDDPEYVPTTAYTYTAQIVATAGAQSQPSNTAGATLTTTKWWEIDPTNLSSAVAAQPTQWNPSSTEQSAAHQVLNQQTMNVVASAMMGTDMNAQFEVFDAPTYNGIWALATGQKTVFFSDPFGNGYYFRIAPQPGGMSTGFGNTSHNTQLLASTAAAPHRTVAVTGVAASRPAV